MTEIADQNLVVKESTHMKFGFDKSFGEILRTRDDVRIIKGMCSDAVLSYSPPNLIFGNSEFSWDLQHRVWEHVAENGKQVSRRSPDVPMMSTLGRGTFLVPGEIVKREDIGVELQVLGISNRAIKSAGILQYVGVPGQIEKPDRIDRSEYFKITRDGKSFFVKRSTATQNPGFSEFTNTQSVKKALKNLDYVDVINGRLGYQDRKESWFVSDWTDIENAGYSTIEVLNLGGINDYGDKPDSSGYSRSEYSRRFSEIKQTLERNGIYFGADFGFNVFYNPASGKILLLDITTTRSAKFNQP